MSEEKSLLFTCSLDDGHPADLHAASILARHGLAATFYVPIRNHEGAPVLARAALRELASRFEIGSHTLDHQPLRMLDLASATHQVVEGKVRLEQLLGRAVDGFCYPAGKFRRAQTSVIRAAGFRYARSTVNLCTATGQRAFEMPTTIQFYPHPRDVYLRNFVRGGDWRRRLPQLHTTLRHRDWPARLYALFDATRQSGGVFHLWGHSKDLHERNAWGEFDRFLAHVARCVGPSARLTNGELAERAYAKNFQPAFAAT